MRTQIAIIGATGNVGRKIVELLLERQSVEAKNLLLFASPKSAGKRICLGGVDFTVQDIATCDFSICQLALFATDSDISKHYAPLAVMAGCKVIDSSSAFRLDPSVPLVVSPVNGELVDEECLLYSTPNCLASPISVVLKPLHEKFDAKRLVVSTYQATSGAGIDAMNELYRESGKVLDGESAGKDNFARPIAFNVIPQVDKFREDGFTGEEFKIICEIKKIVDPAIQVVATSVRVPVKTCHSISLSLQFDKPFTLDEVKAILTASPGVKLSSDQYETPLEVVGSDFVHVGRIRRDPTVQNGLLLWTVSDNLRRGAALDAVEIAEQIVPAKVRNI